MYMYHAGLSQGHRSGRPWYHVYMYVYVRILSYCHDVRVFYYIYLDDSSYNAESEKDDDLE